MTKTQTNFQLSEEQIKILESWMKKQDSNYLQLQKKTASEILGNSTDSNQRLVRWAKQVISSDQPLVLAADSGYYSYTFTPLTIGMKVEVTHTGTSEKITVSEWY
jgi:hypothetical protein